MRQSCVRRGQHLHLCSSALPLLVTLANFTAHCVLYILVVLFPSVISTEFGYRKGASQCDETHEHRGIHRPTFALVDSARQLVVLDVLLAVAVAKGALAMVAASSPLPRFSWVQGAHCMVGEATHPVSHEH